MAKSADWEVVLVKVFTNVISLKGTTDRELDGNKASVSIYPNPSNGTFYLEMPTVLQGKNDLKVYNILGELVAEKELTMQEKTQQVDLGNLQKGIYLLKVANEGLSVTRKIIVE